MAEIYLANGKGVALIDDEDVGRIPLTGWYIHNQGYAQHRWRRPDGSHTHELLHRVVMNAKSGQELDHINHNRLDCRKSNLRLVTRSQNNENWPGAQSTNKLGIRGVMRYETKGGPRFRASIQVRGKQMQKWGLLSLEEATAKAVALRREHFTHSPDNRT